MARAGARIACILGVVILATMGCGTGDGDGAVAEGEERSVEKQLRDTLEKLDWDAVEHAEEMGAEAVPILEEYLKSGGEETRSLAVVCLSYTDDVAAALLMCNALGDASGDVRLRAVEGLADTRHENCRNCYLGHLASPDPRVRDVVAENLGLLDDDSVIGDLTDRLFEERIPEARMSMVLALARLGSSRHIDQFLAGLDSENPDERYETVSRFEYVDRSDLVVHLRPLLDDVAPVFNVGTRDNPVPGRLCDAAAAAVLHFHQDELSIDEAYPRVFEDEELEQVREFLTEMSAGGPE